MITHVGCKKKSIHSQSSIGFATILAADETILAADDNPYWVIHAIQKIYMQVWVGLNAYALSTTHYFTREM